jgi:hypothetical protein
MTSIFASETQPEVQQNSDVHLEAYGPGSLGEALQQVRSFVNEPRQRYRLTRDPNRWNQICVAMDVLADTHLALRAYLSEWATTSVGLKYIAAYGSLQALFIQQDALKHLCESFGRADPIINDTMLMEYRELRNDAIGHPTKRGHKGPHSYHLISRVSMNASGFQLISHSAAKRYEFRWVPIAEMIQKQEQAIRKMLLDLWDVLNEEDAMHRKEFQDRPLAPLLDDLTYAYEKISEDIESGQPVLGTWGLSKIKDALSEFESALQQRGLELSSLEAIQDTYQELVYPLAKLEEFFADIPAAPDRPTARIFLYFVRGQVQHLIDIAREIDADFARE